MMTTMISVLGDTNPTNNQPTSKPTQTPESGWNYLVKQQSLSMTDDRVDAVVVEVSGWDAWPVESGCWHHFMALIIDPFVLIAN